MIAPLAPYGQDTNIVIGSRPFMVGGTMSDMLLSSNAQMQAQAQYPQGLHTSPVHVVQAAQAAQAAQFANPMSMSYPLSPLEQLAAAGELHRQQTDPTSLNTHTSSVHNDQCALSLHALLSSSAGLQLPSQGQSMLLPIFGGGDSPGGAQVCGAEGVRQQVEASGKGCARHVGANCR